MRKAKSSKTHIFLFLIVTAFFIWSLIKPAGGYGLWAAEVAPAAVGLIIVIVTYNRFRLTTLSYIIIAGLAIMTFIGGHYTYTRVPLFNWLKDAFDLNRNHYDRFGHLLKGLLAIVIREIVLRQTQLSRGSWLVAIVTSISLAISSLYEIIEWLSLIITKGGKESKNFLGTQGSMWDAQWDMSLTLIGTILALSFLSHLHNRLLNKNRMS
ncbi:putative membrane protein [Peribacillus deserti]|uniref:Membrane protein n=1 Tax=Peribacillus deserti TaxID=673318 RepID=A0ABS2QGN8_9BACI|nr:putative membrane protein [Peribacillus deserti]